MNDYCQETKAIIESELSTVSPLIEEAFSFIDTENIQIRIRLCKNDKWHESALRLFKSLFNSGNERCVNDLWNMIDCERVDIDTAALSQDELAFVKERLDQHDKWMNYSLHSDVTIRSAHYSITNHFSFGQMMQFDEVAGKNPTANDFQIKDGDRVIGYISLFDYKEDEKVISMWWRINESENEKEITTESVKTFTSAIFQGQINYVFPSSREDCYTTVNVKADTVKIIELKENRELLELEESIGFVERNERSETDEDPSLEKSEVILYLSKE